MLKNWKITAHLLSPLSEEPPMLDALLMYEMSLRLGMKHARKLKRDDTTWEEVPIPVSKYTIGGKDVYRVSSPILLDQWHETTDRLAKRLDTHLVSSMLAETERKSVLVASGSFKMRFAPVRIRNVDKVIYFARCDRKETNKILKKVYAIGKHRVVGYGQIKKWEFEEIEDDLSIYAMHKGQKILMRTVPMCSQILQEKWKGYRKDFGACMPPYWHPQNYIEIATPC